MLFKFKIIIPFSNGDPEESVIIEVFIAGRVTISLYVIHKIRSSTKLWLG